MILYFGGKGGGWEFRVRRRGWERGGKYVLLQRSKRIGGIPDEQHFTPRVVIKRAVAIEVFGGADGPTYSPAKDLVDFYFPDKNKHPPTKRKVSKLRRRFEKPLTSTSKSIRRHNLTIRPRSPHHPLQKRHKLSGTANPIRLRIQTLNGRGVLKRAGRAIIHQRVQRKAEVAIDPFAGGARFRLHQHRRQKGVEEKRFAGRGDGGRDEGAKLGVSELAEAGDGDGVFDQLGFELVEPGADPGGGFLPEETARRAGLGAAGEEDVKGLVGVLDGGRAVVAGAVLLLGLDDAVEDEVLVGVWVEGGVGLADQGAVFVAPEGVGFLVSDGAHDGVEIARVVRGVEVGEEGAGLLLTALAEHGAVGEVSLHALFETDGWVAEDLGRGGYEGLTGRFVRKAFQRWGGLANAADVPADEVVAF